MCMYGARYGMREKEWAEINALRGGGKREGRERRKKIQK